MAFFFLQFAKCHTSNSVFILAQNPLTFTSVPHHNCSLSLHGLLLQAHSLPSISTFSATTDNLCSFHPQRSTLDMCHWLCSNLHFFTVREYYHYDQISSRRSIKMNQLCTQIHLSVNLISF